MIVTLEINLPNDNTADDVDGRITELLGIKNQIEDIEWEQDVSSIDLAVEVFKAISKQLRR